jgi:mannose-1-phosphate guanylyltransferase/phosphomannomutase
MKAVILAGGYGTRLRPLTYSRPKPLIPIGPKPVLQYIIESLAQQHFDDITITTNYLQEQIENYFGDGSRFGVTLRYPKEDKPLGTAGSVKNAERFLDETFAVIQGDNITEINMAEQFRYHEKKRGLATLAVLQVQEPWKYGVVSLDKRNRIVGFQEKPRREECRSNLANTGLYIIEPDVLKIIPKDQQFDFAREVFPKILGIKKPLYGYRARGFWTDVGDVGGLLEASGWLLKKMRTSISPTVDTSEAKIRGTAWIGDGTILEPGVRIEGPVYIENMCKIGKSSTLRGGTMLKHDVNVGSLSTLNGALVFNSTDIHSKVTLTNCVIDEKCEVGSNTLIDSSVIIGAGCKIGENSVIGPGVKLEPGTTIEQGKTIRS